jgi:glutamate transport system permease protein
MSTQNVLFDAPGPKARLRHNILTGVGVLLALGLAFVVLRQMNQAGQLDASLWSPFITDSGLWKDYLLPGLWGTLKAAFLSVIFAGIFGILFGMGRLSTATWIRWPSGVVVEFFRSVPVLLMMIFLFFGWLSSADWMPNTQAPLAAAVIALTLYNGSVIAELIRSGVHSLPKGQSEAGLSIGLTPGQTLRSIQLPQALIGQFVVVLKDTALGYFILYSELLTAAKTAGSAYSNTVPMYIVVAIIFIVMNYALTRLARFVEGWLRSRQVSSAPLTTEAPNIIQGGAEPGGPGANAEEMIAYQVEHRSRRSKDAE